MEQGESRRFWINYNKRVVEGEFYPIRLCPLAERKRRNWIGTKMCIRDSALAALKEGGTFRGTVSTEMLPNAHQFIDMAVELAEKGKVEERELYFPMKTITTDTVDEFMAE